VRVTYVVTTPSFSGPIEVLLQLISSHEVDILDIPLAPVVDAFVATLRDEAVGNVTAVAATIVDAVRNTAKGTTGRSSLGERNSSPTC